MKPFLFLYVFGLFWLSCVPLALANEHELFQIKSELKNLRNAAEMAYVEFERSEITQDEADRIFSEVEQQISRLETKRQFLIAQSKIQKEEIEETKTSGQKRSPRLISDLKPEPPSIEPAAARVLTTSAGQGILSTIGTWLINGVLFVAILAIIVLGVLKLGSGDRQEPSSRNPVPSEVGAPFQRNISVNRPNAPLHSGEVPDSLIL